MRRKKKKKERKKERKEGRKEGRKEKKEREGGRRDCLPKQSNLKNIFTIKKHFQGLPWWRSG